MTEEILEMMEDRRKKLKKGSDAYKEMSKKIKRKCTVAKNQWLNLKCAEIEKLQNTHSSTLYKEINEMSGRKKICCSSGCLKDKNGNILMEKSDILKRWSEYIEELFEDNRVSIPQISKDMQGPCILKDEVAAAINKLKKIRLQDQTKFLLS